MSFRTDYNDHKKKKRGCNIKYGTLYVAVVDFKNVVMSYVMIMTKSFVRYKF